MRDWIRLAFPVIYKGLNVLTKYYGKINKYNKPTTQNGSVTNKAPFQNKQQTKSQNHKSFAFKCDLKHPFHLF